MYLYVFGEGQWIGKCIFVDVVKVEDKEKEDEKRCKVVNVKKNVGVRRKASEV